MRHWKTYSVRNTVKGPLGFEVCEQQTETWETTATGNRKELLVIRRSRNEKGVYEYKYRSGIDDVKHLQLAVADQSTGTTLFCRGRV